MVLPDGDGAAARVDRSEDDWPPDEETSTTACCQMDPIRREAGSNFKIAWDNGGCKALNYFSAASAGI